MSGSDDAKDISRTQDADEKARRARRSSDVVRLNQIFAGQQPIYDKVASDVRAYHTNRVNEANVDQLRNLKFELARRGHLGGSQEIDQSASNQRLVDEALLRAGSLGSQAAADARGRDEQIKSSAAAQIAADLDGNSAINAALAQSGTNAVAAGEYAKGESVADTLQKLAYLYDQRRTAGEEQRAMRDYYGSGPGSAIRPAASGYGGTIVR